MVSPPALIAAMPVGANTTKFLFTFSRTFLRNVVFPVPARPVKKNVVLVSIHVNAAGNGGKWLTATGWSCYTCKGETASDKLAECMYESAAKNLPNMRIRTELSDGDRDWEKDFYILKYSWCPAVLSENFFMDNKSDIAFLNSRTGKDSIVITHVEGIIEWMESI